MAKKLIFVLLFFVVILFAAIYIYCILIDPGEFNPDKEGYRRDIILVIDPTLSMSQENIDEIKSIVKNKLIPNVSLGDRFSCFRIDSKFTEIGNCVFKENDSLKIANNVIGNSSSKYDDNFLCFMNSNNANYKKYFSDKRKIIKSAREDWKMKIDSVKANIGSSDYYNMFPFACGLLKQRKCSKQYLIILGDLINDPWLADPPPPKNEEVYMFENIILRIYTPGGIYNVNGLNKEEIIEHWKTYIKERGGRSDFEPDYLSSFSFEPNTDEVPQ